MESLDLVKRELEPKVSSAVVAAQSLKVANIDDNATATQYAAQFKSLYDQAETERVKMKEPILEAGRRMDKFFKQFTVPLKEAIDIVKEKQSNWFLFEEHKRKLEQDKANKLAEDKEQAKRDALLGRAELAESLGDDKNAERLREQADNVFIPATEIEQLDTTQKTEHGASTFVKDIEVIILDPIAVIKEMASGKYPMTFVKWDMGRIEKYFKSIGAKPSDLQIGIKIKSKVIVKIGGVK